MLKPHFKSDDTSVTLPVGVNNVTISAIINTGARVNVISCIVGRAGQKCSSPMLSYEWLMGQLS